MAKYTFNLSPYAYRSVKFKGKEYGPGEQFKTDEACEMLRFRAAVLDQLTNVQVYGDWEMIERECCDKQAKAAAAKNAHDPEPAGPPASTGTDGRQPKEGDSPQALGGPKPTPPAGAVSREPSEPGEPDGRPPAQQAYDPVAPSSDSDIADRLAAEGASQKTIDERLAEARRGDPPPGQAHPFRSRDEPTHGVVASDPVNLFTGEFSITCVDLELPGRGFDFRLVRHYRSDRPAYGPFGFNWDHSYNVYLRELNDGAVAVWTGELREDVYRPHPAGGFMPPAAARYANLVIDRDPFGSVTGYQLIFRGGFVWEFARPPGWVDGLRYPLVRAADRHGNGHGLRYDSMGRLDAVVDTVGRVIRFHYGTCGLLEAVTDPAGRRIEYHHAADAEQLVCVVGPIATGGPQRTSYEYADAGHPALRNNIVVVRGSDGRAVLENVYGHDPSSDAWNRVVEQRTDSYRYRFGYESFGYVSLAPESTNDVARQVEVVEPDGSYRVFSFNVRGLLLDERVRLAADRSYRVWAVTYRYNANGEMVELRRPNGLTTRFVYDADAADPRQRGNLLEVRLVAPPTAGVASRRLWSATYEPRYQELMTVTDEAGRTTRYVYDYEEDPLGGGTGRLVRVEHPSATRPDGTTQTSADEYEVNDEGQVTRWRSGEGHAFDIFYHATGPGAGQVRRMVAGAGTEDETVTLDYDQFGYVRAVTDAFGATWSTVWDALGRMVEQSAPAVAGNAAVTRYRYARSGQLSEVHRPRGMYADARLVDPYLRDVIQIDPKRGTEQYVEAANTVAPRTSTRKLDHMGRTVLVVDPLGRRTRFRYDERGLLLEVSGRTGQAPVWHTRYTYDRNGNVRRIRRTGEPDVVCEYDTWDRLLAVRTPVTGAAVEYAYDVGDVVRRVRAVGPMSPGRPPVELGRVDFDYDERGRPTSRREAGTWQQFWYDRDDQLTRVTDQRGRSFVVVRDALGRARQIIDPLGNRQRTVVDAAGRVTDLFEDEVDPAGVVRTFHRTYGYDAAHRLTSADDGDSHVTIAGYDTRDLVVSLTGPGPGSERVEIGYDAFGDLVSLRSGSQGQRLTEFVRDANGQVRAYVDPLGRRTTYQYADDRSWASITLPDGRRRIRLFDEFGRVAAERGPAGDTVRFTYGPDGMVYRTSFTASAGKVGLPDLVQIRDGLGRPVRLEQGAESLGWRWDALGRLVEETSNQGAAGWRYDDQYGLADLIYPDGRVDRVELDPLDRPARTLLLSPGTAGLSGLSAGDPIATYAYVGPDRLARRGHGNGTAVTYEYDAARRLAAVRHTDVAGARLATVRYVYDGASRRRMMLVEPGPATNRWYDYDEAGRLVTAVEGITATPPPASASQAQHDAYLAALGRPAGSREFSYMYSGADGRRRQSVLTTAGTSTDDYVLDPSGQISSLTRSGPGITTLFTYHADGQRQVDDRYGYTYDVLGRLREVRYPGGAPLLRLGYDPVGRQVELARANAPPERVVWLGGRPVQRDVTGAPAAQYATGLHGDEVVAASDGTDLWMHSDGRLSLLAVSGPDGSPMERYDYEPFGAASIWAPDGGTPRGSSTVGMVPRFGGYPQLLPGLFDARGRTYDAVTGAFLQRDPRGYVTSPNPYAFGGHDPVNFVDPTGELIFAAFAVGAAFGLGYSIYDFYHHPERYRGGDLFWRTMMHTLGGGAVGLLAAVVGVAAGGVATSFLGGSTVAAGTAAAGSAGAGGIGWFGSFLVGGVSAATAGAVWSGGFHRMFPEIVDKPSAGGAAFDFATGGVFSFARPLIRAVAPNMYASVRTGLVEVAEGLNRARSRTWLRPFGTQWRLMFGKSRYLKRNMIWHDEDADVVRGLYRHVKGWQRGIGNSLGHLWGMESGPLPRGLRNAGLNLMEMPMSLNNWARNIVRRNVGIRVAVTGIGLATGLTTFELTALITGWDTGHYILGDDPPVEVPTTTPGATGQVPQQSDTSTGKP